MTQVSVIGSGSWGTAIAAVLADAGHEVTMWARREQIAEEIATVHRNNHYLPDIELPSSITATCDPVTAVQGSNHIVWAIPTQTTRQALQQWGNIFTDQHTVISLAKGIELGSNMRISEVIAETAGLDPHQIAVLSGPNLAMEIAHKQPSATVIAAPSEEVATNVQRLFATNYLRPYTNTDVVGVEIGGACKNVIALVCGMAAGLGYGYNTSSSLMTRGLAEISRLGVSMGADPLTFAGLAGIGDLVATCSSPLSRNRTFGHRLGLGDSIEQAKAATNGQVAEGVKSCEGIRTLGQHYSVEMPLTEGAFQVCSGNLTVTDMAQMLMGRTTKSE